MRKGWMMNACDAYSNVKNKDWRFVFLLLHINISASNFIVVIKCSGRSFIYVRFFCITTLIGHWHEVCIFLLQQTACYPLQYFLSYPQLILRNIKL